MTPLFYAKVLIGSPFIAVIVALTAIYATAYEDEWISSSLYQHDISDLGATWSAYRFIFATEYDLDEHCCIVFISDLGDDQISGQILDELT